MNRSFLRAIIVVVAISGFAFAIFAYLNRPRTPIRVGILHSKTGELAVSELRMIDAEIFALEEINAKGGLLGRPVEWVVADGQSDPKVFGEAARRLIEDEKVSLIIGCWSSACRKSVKEVVEKFDHLLIYPVAFEGLEASPQILYTGAAPNQQIIPAVSFATQQLHAKSFFVVGSSSIWAKGVSAIVSDELKSLQVPLLGEALTTRDEQSFVKAVDSILKTKPDVIFNVVEGEANAKFLRMLREKGIKASQTAIISLAINEDEARSIPNVDLAGTYSIGSYFQSFPNSQNQEFVKQFEAYLKRAGKATGTSDSVATAYSSLKLWAQAVSDADSTDPKQVRNFLSYQSFNAPEGVISVDRNNQYTWRAFAVGKIQANGTIEVIWRLRKPNRPNPFPNYRSTKEWNQFLQTLYQDWGGSWTAP